MKYIKSNNLLSKLKKQVMNLNEGHRLFALYLIGIMCGTCFVNIFIASFYDNIGIYGKYLTCEVNILKCLGIDKWDYFLYCAKRYYIHFVIIVILNLHSKRKYINSVICIYKGMMASILICFATINYGAGGLILFIISIFPHYILYIPMFVFGIYFAMNLNKYIRNGKYVKWIIKGCFIESVLILGTAFCEAYINLSIIINIFT